MRNRTIDAVQDDFLRELNVLAGLDVNTRYTRDRLNNKNKIPITTLNQMYLKASIVTARIKEEKENGRPYPHYINGLYDGYNERWAYDVINAYYTI